MRKVSYIFILIVLTFSCRKNGYNNTQKIRFIEDLKTQEIKFEKINYNNLFLGRPGQIIESDNKIILVDLFEGKAATFYNTTTDSLIGRYFNIGQGPNDVSWPIDLDITSDLHSIYERQTGRYREYNPDSLLLNNSYEFSRYLRFDLANQLIKTNFGFICTGWFEPGLINLYNKGGDLINNFDPFVGRLSDDIETDHRFMVGQGVMSYINHSNSFLYATYFTGDIFIYKYVNEDLTEKEHIILGKEILNEDRKHYEVREEYMYYVLDIDSSDRYHYLLYTSNPKTGKRESQHILKIDEFGKIVTCYQFKKQVEKFYVSDNDSYFLGVVENDDGEYEINKAWLSNN